MINNYKLVELSKQYPNDIVLYNQDVKSLMKLPGRIPGEFDNQLLEFLKITNGALILDYRFYGFKNILFSPSLDQNLKDKWYEWQHIAGTIIPFVGSSSNFGFGYLEKVPFEGSHPIVFFSEFPEDTKLIASGFDVFFDTFINYVELSLIEGNNIEITIDNWPFNTDKLIQKDASLHKLITSNAVTEVIESIKKG
jgi:hypothetical protein